MNECVKTKCLNHSEDYLNNCKLGSNIETCCNPEYRAQGPLEEQPITPEAPKESDGKTPWEIFPFQEAEFTCRVFGYGVKKYGAPFTYRKGIPMEKLAAAVIRHATAILSGERIDPESGELHSAHISAGGLMMISQSISEEGL